MGSASGKTLNQSELPEPRKRLMCEHALCHFESEKYGGRNSGINDVCLLPAYKLVSNAGQNNFKASLPIRKRSCAFALLLATPS